MVTELAKPTNKNLLREGDYPQNLFGSQTVISDSATLHSLTEGMDQKSPQALRWIKAKTREGTLNDALALLVSRGYAADAKEALGRLAEDISSLPSNPATRLCDLNGSKIIPRWQKMAGEVKTGSKAKPQGLDLRFLGTLNHGTLAPHLLVGSALFPIGDAQGASPTMFPEDCQLSFGGVWEEPAVVSRSVKTEKGFTSDEHLGKISDGLAEMRAELPILNGGGEAALMAELMGKYPVIRKLQNDLGRLLFPVLGEERIKRLRSPHDAYGNFLAARSLMSLAAAVLYAHETGKNFLASEVPVLQGQKVRGLSGGRLDLLEILAVNDKSPNQRQLELMAKAVRHRQYKGVSVGPLAANLMRLFGSRLDFSVFDLKFEYGDGGGKKPLDYNEIVAAPQKKHQDQMRRYLTVADLDLHLQQRVSSDKRADEPVWSDNTPFQFGEITHFFADGKPVGHILEVSGVERTRFFREDILPWLPQGKGRAIVREVDNFVSSLVEQPAALKCAIPPIRTIPMDLHIEETNPYERALQEVIDGSREFIDENGLVERRYGRNGKPYNVFHLNRAIATGWIPGRTDLTKDVNIPCPLPGHPRGDRHPSARLYHDGHVYCFVHGEGMLITEEEVPEHLLGVFKTWSGERRQREVKKYLIPPEHALFMDRMQEVLQNIYRQDERGLKYLAEKRCLDPDLAFHYGVGFANRTLITGLMDYGYTLEDMTHFGVVDYSKKIPYPNSLGPYLEKLGLKRDRVVRKLKDEDSGKMETSFPIFQLEDQVTFPLEGKDEETGEWAYTNFYGRSIDTSGGIKKDKGRPIHNKLKVEHTGVAVGGFNVRRALDSKYGILYVTEAAIDALTAIEFGYEPIAAVIGLHNPTLVRLLAREAEERGLDIAAVFDDENEGRKRTMGFVEEVREDGFTNKIIPFMNFFMGAHPHVGCKDFNALKVGQVKGGLRPGDIAPQTLVENFADPFGNYPVWHLDAVEEPEELELSVK